MKFLIDTCGWIEWLTEGRLVKSFAAYFKDVEKLLVPTLVQYELYKWICRERNSAMALEIIGITASATVAPLETSLSLYAADVSKEYGLAMTDAIVYATSIKHNALLVTCDQHFKGLPQVEFFAKAAKVC